MGQVDNIVRLLQRVTAAVAVVLASNLSLSFAGQPVPLEINAFISMLISTGIGYKFLQDVLNELASAGSVQAREESIGDTILPF